MPLPYLVIAGKKVSIFKHFNYYYGPLINTTPAGSYTVQQNIKVHDETLSFTWPSAEQAYHAQKIIHLKSKLAKNNSMQPVLTQALRNICNAVKQGQEFFPDDYKKIVEQLTARYPRDLGADKDAFDAKCDANFHKTKPSLGINPTTAKAYTLEFMRTVLRLKLEQHPTLADMVLQLAREGVIPIEISRKDFNWASGPDGSGLNMLGILVLEEGNRLLVAAGETPQFQDAETAYKNLQNSAQAELRHDALERQEPQMQQKKSHGVHGVQNEVPKPRQNEGYWVFNRAQTKAAFIHNHCVITGAYKSSPDADWCCGNDLSRFQDMLNYKSSDCFHSSDAKTVWVYNNSDPKLATRAALCYDGNVVTGIFKRSGVHSTWEKGNDLSQFNDLISKKHTAEKTFHASGNAAAARKTVASLIQRLRLDEESKEHMTFWQNQVTVGGIKYKNYTLPHTIAKALSYIEKNKKLPYEQFKNGLEQTLKENSDSLSSTLGLVGLFRSKAVSALRHHAQANQIEYFTPIDPRA